jgi:hypothetical protein
MVTGFGLPLDDADVDPLVVLEVAPVLDVAAPALSDPARMPPASKPAPSRPAAPSQRLGAGAFVPSVPSMSISVLHSRQRPVRSRRYDGRSPGCDIPLTDL